MSSSNATGEKVAAKGQTTPRSPIEPPANPIGIKDSAKGSDSNDGDVKDIKVNEGTGVAAKELDKVSKPDQLKKRAQESREKATIEAMARLAMFDSTKAKSWKTTGTSALGALKTEKNDIVVGGRNTRAEQTEPDWSREQIAAIRAATSQIVQIASVIETRRSSMDPEQIFVGRDDDGSIVPTENAYFSNIGPDKYVIGTGPEKYDVTGSPRHYTDLVMADVNGQWLVNQWVSEGIIIEGVSQQVLMQQGRQGNTSNRRIGHHFARIGLPKYAFGPVFNTIRSNWDGALAKVSETTGYYWVNASWGVSSFNAVFSYMTKDGVAKTTSLPEVMRMLNGKSSISLATIAISLTCASKMIEGKPVPDTSSYGLSIKLHNAPGIDVVDYHGPPQQGSTGMLIPARLAQKAAIMGAQRNATGNVNGGIFSNSHRSIFANVKNTPERTRHQEHQRQRVRVHVDHDDPSLVHSRCRTRTAAPVLAAIFRWAVTSCLKLDRIADHHQNLRDAAGVDVQPLDLNILMAAWSGNIDRYVRLQRPRMVSGEHLCLTRGVYHDPLFAKWWSTQPEARNPACLSIVNARFVMSNDLSWLTDAVPDSHLPRMMWFPQHADTATYLELARRRPVMKTWVARA